MAIETNSSPSTTYTGVDNLESMELAENYNASIGNLILKASTAPKSALDFGAGTGTFSIFFRKHCSTLEVLETDLSLQSRLKNEGFQVHSSLKELQPSSFDFVYSVNVLEHIDDDVETLSELFNLLTPGGRLFLYLPAFMILWTTMDTKVKHFRRYTRSEITQKLAAAGFEVNGTRYCDAIGFFATLLFKLIGSRDGSISPRSVKFFDRILFPLNRILDPLLGSMTGKNVWVVATRKV